MPTIEPATPTGRYVLEEWENEGGPDPQMREAILKIEAEAAAPDPLARTPVQELETVLRVLPTGWKLMIGREVFKPVDKVRFADLDGKIIWWAVANEPWQEWGDASKGGHPGRIISAERHPSIESALTELAGLLRGLV